MRERQLFSGPLFDIAEFACPPQDEAWRDVNVIESASPLVVFPHTTVGIHPGGAAPVLATPNLVMLYNPGQEYERTLHDARGDECLYVALHPPAVEELEAEGGAIRDGRMTATHAPADRVAYLHQHLLGRHLRGAAPDALLVEETTMRLVRSVVRHLPQPAAAPRRNVVVSRRADGEREGAARRVARRAARPARGGGTPRRLALPPRARVPQQNRLRAPPVPHAAAPAARARTPAGERGRAHLARVRASASRATATSRTRSAASSASRRRPCATTARSGGCSPPKR